MIKTGGTQQSFHGEAPPQGPNTSLLGKVPLSYTLYWQIVGTPSHTWFRGVASPFSWSLPEKAVIGSNVTAP